MAQTIHLGISTCPNDTFAFHGLITRAVDWRGLRFEVELLDIQQLNDRLLHGAFAVVKDAGSQHSISAALLHAVGQMVEVTHAARCNDGHGREV